MVCSMLALTFVAATVSSLWPHSAQGASGACPLKPAQKVAAVKAFTKMAPVFQESRCLNCHGAVNPFSRTGGHGGGYIDIRRETQDFLKMPGLERALTTGSDPTGAISAKTIAQLKEIAESPSDISDNDVIRVKAFDPMRQACKECHISSWIIPMRHNYFVGRSKKEMCIHLKRSSLTNTPVSFLRHMQDDELVREGFKGRRGLLESVAPEPPKISSATVAKHANEWVEAMGAKFHDPPDCGCAVDGIILEINHHMQANPKSGASRLGYAQFDGTVRFDVLLEPVQGTESWFRGEVSVIRPMIVRHVTPSFWRCAGSGSQTEHWLVSAILDSKTDSLKVQFGFVASDEKATWTCTAPNGMTATSPLYIDLHESLESVEVSAKTGAKKEVSTKDGVSNEKFFESFSVLVVEGIDKK